MLVHCLFLSGRTQVVQNMSLVADDGPLLIIEWQASSGMWLVADVCPLPFLSGRPLVVCHWLPMSVCCGFVSSRTLVVCGWLLMSVRCLLFEWYASGGMSVC